MSSQGLIFVAAAVVVSVAARVVSAAVVVASAVNPGGTVDTAGTVAGEQLRRDQRPWQLVELLLGHTETGSPFRIEVESSPLSGPLWEAGERSNWEIQEESRAGTAPPIKSWDHLWQEHSEVLEAVWHLVESHFLVSLELDMVSPFFWPCWGCLGMSSSRSLCPSSSFEVACLLVSCCCLSLSLCLAALYGLLLPKMWREEEEEEEEVEEEEEEESAEESWLG